MKKLLAMILCLALLLLAGCELKLPDIFTELMNPTEGEPATEASTDPTDPTDPPAPTEPPVTEPPAPDTVSGTVLADRTALILMTVDRDTVVEIAGDFDEDHYVIRAGQGYGLIEKRLVRPADAEAYAQWDGYAYSGAKLYDSYHLLAAGAQDLSMNTQIQVIDSFGDNCVVQVGETIGYMRQSDISRGYIQYKPSGGADGGDISLRHRGGASVSLLSTFVPQSGEVSGTATVLVNGAEITLGWYDRGESVGIIAEDGFLEEREGFYGVYLDGFCGYVRQNLIAHEGAEAYTEWDGYARYNAAVYGNYYLSGEPASKLSTNTEIHVICDLGNCYLVSVGETMGYMEKAQISETRISYSGGGSSSGGEWSDPVL